MVYTVFHHNWWVVALRGIAAVLFGVLTLLLPGLTLLVLVMLFAAFSLADGIFTIIIAIRTAKSQPRWWALLLEGIFSAIIGLIAFLWPGISSLALLYLIASWCIVTAVLEIVSAIRLRKEIKGEGFLILHGVLSLLFGLLLVVFPASGALVVAWMIGIFALTIGGLMIGLSFRLRKEENQFKRNSSLAI